MMIRNRVVKLESESLLYGAQWCGGKVFVHRTLSVAGLIRHVIVLPNVHAHGFQKVRMDTVLRKRIADVTRCSGGAVRIEARGAWIVHHDQIAVRVPRLRKVACSLEGGRNRTGKRSARSLTKAFIGGKEERPILTP